MGLDDRLLEAAAVKLAWKEPTDIQKRAIPLIMAPTKELCRQTQNVLKDLVSSCGRVVRSVDVSDHRFGTDLSAHKPLIVGDVPDIIVGTPSRVLMHIEAGHLDGLKDTLEILVWMKQI